MTSPLRHPMDRFRTLSPISPTRTSCRAVRPSSGTGWQRPPRGGSGCCEVAVHTGVDDRSHQSTLIVGNPSQVANQIEKAVALPCRRRIDPGAARHTAGLDEFADTVVPILQERDRFRTDYDRPSLRTISVCHRRARLRGHGPPSLHAAHDLAARTLVILDLVPVSRAPPLPRPFEILSTRTDAERRAIAATWFAEHHLNPGVAARRRPSSSPWRPRQRTTSASDRAACRVATGLPSVVEEFGLLDAPHPGRIDLGIGRSDGRNFFRDRLAHTEKNGDRPRREPRHTENGVLIPAPPSLRGLASARTIRLTAERPPAGERGPLTTGS